MADQKHFLYVDNPYWRPSYADTIDVLLKQIPPYIDQIRNFVANPSNEVFVKGFLEEYHNTYIFEICSSENKISLKEYIQIDRLDNCNDSEGRKKLKVKNLLKATKYAFGDTFSDKTYNHNFTVDLAKKLNGIIGRELFNNAEPPCIESSMQELFDDTGRKIKQDLNLQDRIELSAYFFDKFLAIHPFSNGNGRTARILLSAILIEYTYIPMSLFSSSFKDTSNSEYLHCMEEAHAYNNYELLNSLIIESIHRICHMFLTSLDVQSDDF